MTKTPELNKAEIDSKNQTSHHQPAHNQRKASAPHRYSVKDKACNGVGHWGHRSIDCFVHAHVLGHGLCCRGAHAQHSHDFAEPVIHYFHGNNPWCLYALSCDGYHHAVA